MVETTRSQPPTRAPGSGRTPRLTAWWPSGDDWRLYWLIVSARIRSDWQYRVSFLTFLCAQALVTSLEFIAILFLLEISPDLGGWNRAEVAFLFAMASLPFGLADVFVSAVDRVSTYVQAGTFDRVLLRPVPAMLQMSALEFELRRIGRVIPSTAVLIWSLPRVGIEWTPGRLLVLVVALACGAVIYSALWIMTSAFAFWAVASQEAMNAATYGGEYANQYPLHLYDGWIRAVLGWIIPLAFVAYVPAIYLLDVTNPLGLPRWLIFGSVPVAAASLAVALRIWSIGIAHYQGTGS